MRIPIIPWTFASLLSLLSADGSRAAEQKRPVSVVQSIMSEYCFDCHDSDLKKGGPDLASIRFDDVTPHAEAWEKVVRKFGARQMPPLGKKRPGGNGYDAVVSWLTASLDNAAARNPNPGRTETFRRLNRAEYQNAIRDLLALEIDASALLPKDDSSHGFDNVTSGALSPTLLDRYVSAAQKISRM